MVAVLAYPHVLSELETLREIVAGRSLARYGDGEFKLCRGAGIKSQRFEPGIDARLRGILKSSGHCLVGIPNLHSPTPKREFWLRYERYASYLANRPYVSSFVTRPDSAPWINTPEYWALLEQLWVGREVTLVRGSTKSLCAEDLVGAARVHEIVAPRQHAWCDYQQILERVLYTQPTRVLLCLGPTATAMAVDLCAQGVHAVDLGHVGMFLRKYRCGEAMVVTEQDKQPV